MNLTQDIKASARVLTSEVLRCHGFEKNLQAISLMSPDQLDYVLNTTDPQLLPLLPTDAQAYAKTSFSTDFARLPS